MHEISNAQLFYIIGRDVPDGLLTGENQELPFARHIVSTLQHFHFIEYIVVVVFMEPEKTIIKEPAASNGVSSLQRCRAAGYWSTLRCGRR